MIRASPCSKLAWKVHHKCLILTLNLPKFPLKCTYSLKPAINNIKKILHFNKNQIISSSLHPLHLPMKIPHKTLKSLSTRTCKTSRNNGKWLQNIFIFIYLLSSPRMFLSLVLSWKIPNKMSSKWNDISEVRVGVWEN